MKDRARVAGVFYLITIITGVFAEVFARGAVFVRDDAAATATNILAHEQSYRLGLIADLVMLASYVIVTVLFYDLFKPVHGTLSALAASFSLVGIGVLAANSLNHIAPLVYLNSTLQTTQSQTLALISLRMHARGYSISGVFFGIYCMMIGYLAVKSGFVPRILGVLVALGGVTFMTSSVTLFLLPGVAGRLPDLSMLGGAGSGNSGRAIPEILARLSA